MPGPLNVANPVQTNSISISAQSLKNFGKNEDLSRMKRRRKEKLGGRKMEILGKISKSLKRKVENGDGDKRERSRSRKGSELNCQRSRTLSRKSKSVTPPLVNQDQDQGSRSGTSVKKTRPKRKTTRKPKHVREESPPSEAEPKSKHIESDELVDLIPRVKSSSVKKRSCSKSVEKVAPDQYLDQDFINQANILEDQCCKDCGNFILKPNMSRSTYKSVSRSKSISRTRTLSGIPSIINSVANFNNRPLIYDKPLIKKEMLPEDTKISPEKPLKPKKRANPNKTIHRNPFVNFLRLYRKNHSDWHPCKIAIEGSKKWLSISEKEQSRFTVRLFDKTAQKPGKPKKITSTKRYSVLKERKRIRKWLKNHNSTQKHRGYSQKNFY